MSTDWNDAKKWPDADKLAEMLSALGKIKGHAASMSDEAMPEVLVVLKVLGRGIGDVYQAFHKITQYNEATHEQFAKQIEATRTLVTAVKEQDKQIKKLTKRLDSLEKKQAKKPTSKAPIKKIGWFR